MVVRDRSCVDPAALGRDPAPLERESVGVVTVGGRQREVLVEALVMPARRAALVAAVDPAWDLLESPPVVLVVAALDLVGGGRGAPMDESGAG